MRKTTRFAALAALAFAAGASLLAPAPLRAEGAPSAAATRIKADVETLASDALKGRRAGTPEGEAVAKWVADSFRKIGLLPGGGAGSYLQTFEFIDGVDLGPKNALSTAAGGPVGRMWKAGTDFRPLAFSTAGAVEAEIVFVGYGITAKELDWDDYAGLDVTGRIVLALRYSPDGDDEKSPFSPYAPLRYKASIAREKGAAAILVATGPRTKDVADDLIALRTDASFSDAGLPAFSVKRPVAEALFSGAGKTLEEAQKAIDEAKRPVSFALAKSRATAVADVTPRRAKAPNVLGLLTGSDPARNTEVVVIGAHWDHLGLGGPSSLEKSPEGKIHHGADDNASGVAALLELARTISTRRAELPRSILFLAFGAEELGTLGALHFTKNPTVPIEKIVAMVNLDMVGRLRNDTLDVHGVGTSPAWRPLLEKANEGLGLKLKIHEGGFGPSDHSAFYAVRRPVLFLFTGAHADYHRPSDTADKISVEGIEKLLRLLTPVVTSVAKADERIAFTAVAADKETMASGSRGFKVWVGGIPDYSEEGSGGVRLTGVSPGSPAETAGLLAGDVIVKFGEKEIRNIYDYTYALQGKKPGEKVTVVVNRTEGGKTAPRSIEVTLGSRPSATK